MRAEEAKEVTKKAEKDRSNGYRLNKEDNRKKYKDCTDKVMPFILSLVQREALDCKSSVQVHLKTLGGLSDLGLNSAQMYTFIDVLCHELEILGYEAGLRAGDFYSRDNDDRLSIHWEK